jgi:hypothetical protein
MFTIKIIFNRAGIIFVAFDDEGRKEGRAYSKA